MLLLKLFEVEWFQAERMLTSGYRRDRDGAKRYRRRLSATLYADEVRMVWHSNQQSCIYA
jgi:hypothetical protein